MEQQSVEKTVEAVLGNGPIDLTPAQVAEVKDTAYDHIISKLRAEGESYKGALEAVAKERDILADELKSLRESKDFLDKELIAVRSSQSDLANRCAKAESARASLQRDIERKNSEIEHARGGNEQLLEVIDKLFDKLKDG